MLGLAIEAFRILHSFDSEKMTPLTSAHGKDNLICMMRGESCQPDPGCQ